MKKIKLPLEMANGVMVRTLDELKENWDLEKIVSHFGDGRLVTWLNDRYYTDLAEQVQKIMAKGVEAQKELCAIFGMEFKQDEVVDAEELAERKRKLDILRQFTSDDDVLKNVDYVAFDQEDLADLLDEGVEKIYLCNGKFSVPLSMSGKKYIGVADAEVYIGKDELQDFEKLGISFENVKFDEKYQKLVDEKKQKEDEKRKAEAERVRIQNSKKVGDIIKFGKWGGEEIEWKILDIQDGKALVLSKFGLDTKPYTTETSVTWETCTLRNWLNKDFFRNAFGRTEQKAIITSKVTADKNPDYDTNPGNDTEDKLFLLSILEAEKYFENNEERKCYATNFAKNNGAHVDGECSFPVSLGYLMRSSSYNSHDVPGVSRWWLRSPGKLCNVSCVDYDGSLNCIGMSVALMIMHREYRGGVVVRPAMWVDLSKM